MTSELITEPAEATHAQLAIVTRIFPQRRNRLAIGEGDRSKHRLNAKVTRVSLTRMRGALKGSVDRRIDVEVLAEFPGPTGEDAARDFIKLLQQPRARSADIPTCRADGSPPLPLKPWTDGKATFHLIA